MPKASSEFPLRGWYVISLRPLGQHGGVRRCAAALGARVFAVSTLRLRSLDAGESLARALACPRVIVSSPAAARFAHAQRALEPRRDQQWLALGAGTAGALRRLGVRQVDFPAEGSDSEALLALPALRAVAGQPIGLVTAPGGRGVIAARLRERGAQLEIAEVYARHPVQIADSRLQPLAAMPEQSAMLLTSAEAFDVLWQALEEDERRRWRARPCVVASQRLEAQARSLGFDRLVRAVNAGPPALLAALRDHVLEGGFR